MCKRFLVLLSFVAVVVVCAGPASAAIVSGYLQRFDDPAANYSSGVWTASAGANATAANSSYFSVITDATPSGLSALSNSTDDGSAKLSFTLPEAWSASGFTIMGVAKLNAEQGNGRGPIGSPETASWSGARIGIGSTGANNLRVEAGNTNPGDEGGPTALRANGDSYVPVDEWFIFSETVTKNNGSNQAVATLTIYALDDLSVLGTATVSVASGDIQGISSSSNLFSSTNDGGWRAALADLVVYNSFLGSSDVTTNLSFFQDTYQTGGGSTIPEPGTVTLLAAALVGLLAYAWRKRK